MERSAIASGVSQRASDREGASVIVCVLNDGVPADRTKVLRRPVSPTHARFRTGTPFVAGRVTANACQTKSAVRNTSVGLRARQTVTAPMPGPAGGGGVVGVNPPAPPVPLSSNALVSTAACCADVRSLLSLRRREDSLRGAAQVGNDEGRRGAVVNELEPVSERCCSSSTLAVIVVDPPSAETTPDLRRPVIQPGWFGARSLRSGGATRCAVICPLAPLGARTARPSAGGRDASVVVNDANGSAVGWRPDAQRSIRDAVIRSAPADASA